MRRLTPDPAPTPRPQALRPGPAPIRWGRGFLSDFGRFLETYGVIGLAIAFILGQALNTLVKSLVDGLLMPFVTPLLSFLGENWQTATGHAWIFGPFLVGRVLADVVYFVAIALLVFAVAKLILRQSDVKKI